MCRATVDERMRGGKAHASIVPDIPRSDSIGPVVLLSLIASHHDLDLAVLERLSADTHAIGHEIVAGCAPVTGAVVLATCNRFELYLEVDDPEHVADARAAVAAVVAARSGYSVERVETELHVGTGVEVAEHLFAVASGLDSMVVGEREIAGQVRRALSAARRDGTTTSDLEALFQAASRTSRTVGSSTGLGGAGRSVVSVALDLVQDDLPAWPDVRCVLIGTGSYAGASFAALRARGCSDIRVFSPSGRAHAFATARGARAITGSDLHAELTDVDLVVACSGAPGAVLEVEALAAARVGVDRPLAVVDLALRHDVDPGVRELPGVRLVSLTTVSEHAPDEHSAPVAAAHEIVARTAADFQADRRMRLRNPGIIAERTRVLTGLETAIEALGSTDERAVRALRRRTRLALHGPTVRARDAARAGDEAGFAAALAELAAIPVPDVTDAAVAPDVRLDVALDVAPGAVSRPLPVR